MKFVLCKLFFICFSIALVHSTEDSNYDPCCSLPCMNAGVCFSSSIESYQCDCTETGYYGKHCDTPYFSTRIWNLVKPSKSFTTYALTNFRPFWHFVNNVRFLRRFLMKAILKMRVGMVIEPSPFAGVDTYSTWETYINGSVYARTLPAVPKNCPTPMGVVGKKQLPDPEQLVEKLLFRKDFKPCSKRTSLLFPYYASHFVHQFFKTDRIKGVPNQWGTQSVDLSQIYGQKLSRVLALRLMKDGKLKYSTFDGEMYPPFLNQTEIPMFESKRIPKDYRFATGHPVFPSVPMNLYFATIWLREHNRICDILKKENPGWDDERIFQTTRFILTAQMIKITIEDYVQHLSGFHFQLFYDPTLLHGSDISFHNQIHQEFVLLYHWHALLPDFVKMKDKAYSFKDTLFNPKPFVDTGMTEMTNSLINQFAGTAAGGKNQGIDLVADMRKLIVESRKLRMQSFNKYREKFGMKPYSDFNELTDNKEMAAELKSMYGDIDAVEYFIGIMVEKKRTGQIFGETLTEMGSPFSLKGLMSSPINSKHWWRPSNFGGQTGFQIIKDTNLEKLVCRNVKGCPKATFTVPKNVNYKLIKPASSCNQKPTTSGEYLHELMKEKYVKELRLPPDFAVSQLGPCKQKQEANSKEINKHDTGKEAAEKKKSEL